MALDGYVEIQRKNKAGTWCYYKRNPFSFTTSPGQQLVRQVASRCAAGTFRTHSYVVGTWHGQSETRDRVSPETRNPCKK